MAGEALGSSPLAASWDPLPLHWVVPNRSVVGSLPLGCHRVGYLVANRHRHLAAACRLGSSPLAVHLALVLAGLNPPVLLVLGEGRLAHSHHQHLAGWVVRSRLGNRQGGCLAGLGNSRSPALLVAVLAPPSLRLVLAACSPPNHLVH